MVLGSLRGLSSFVWFSWFSWLCLLVNFGERAFLFFPERSRLLVNVGLSHSKPQREPDRHLACLGMSRWVACKLAGCVSLDSYANEK